MKVRPFGAALRGEAPNRLMLRWLKTVVVNDEDKAPGEASGGGWEDDCCRSIETLSDDAKTGVWCEFRDQPGGSPPIGQVVSGVEAA